jgi:hypothetical protein
VRARVKCPIRLDVFQQTLNLSFAIESVCYMRRR